MRLIAGLDTRLRLAASDRDLGSTGRIIDGTFGGDNSKKIIADGPWAIRKPSGR